AGDDQERDRARAGDAELLVDKLFGAGRNDLGQAPFERTRDELGVRLDEDGGGGREDREEGEEGRVGGGFGGAETAVGKGGDEATQRGPEKGPGGQPPTGEYGEGWGRARHAGRRRG